MNKKGKRNCIMVLGLIISALSCNAPTENDSIDHIVPSENSFTSNVTIDNVVGIWKILLLRASSNQIETNETFYFYYWEDNNDPHNFAKYSEFIDIQKDSVNVYAKMNGNNCITKVVDSNYYSSPFPLVKNAEALLKDTNQTVSISKNGDTLRFIKKRGSRSGPDYYYYVKYDTSLKSDVCM